MNKEQQKEVLKGIYLSAINTLLEAVDNRQKAVHQHETYLDTVEATIKVFNQDFNIERDLKLVSRGIDETTLRYVTRLDMQSQREQLDFYRDTRNNLYV